MYVRIPYCAPGSEEQNPAKLAAIESAIIKAYAARAPGVRTGIHTATMAPSRDPLDWDWSFLDFTVGLCKRYGLKVLLELAYGGVEGECESDCWDSTDQFEPVSTDHEDLAGFYVATVQRFEEVGAYLSDGRATLGLDDLTRVGGGIVAADLMTAGV